jgi:hypothetical protein
MVGDLGVAGEAELAGLGHTIQLQKGRPVGETTGMITEDFFNLLESAPLRNFSLVT